jgi:hypothetical protein
MDTTIRPLPVDAGTNKESDDASREEKKSRKTRKPMPSARNGGSARYFLAANVAEDAPSLSLGEEFSNEDEVLVASFQKGVAFYRVETWKTRAEKKGRNMVLRKQS